jgi:hypothetical protein
MELYMHIPLIIRVVPTQMDDRKGTQNFQARSTDKSIISKWFRNMIYSDSDDVQHMVAN